MLLHRLRALAWTALLIAACSSSSTPPPPDPVNVTPATAALRPSQRQQFTARAADGGALTVTWSLQEGSAAGTLTADGYYTAGSTTGTFHVVASLADQPEVQGRATVTVSALQVTVTPATVTLPPGAARQFAATDQDGQALAVTWSLEEGAAAGTITPGGLYTAGDSPGTYHVVATSVAEPDRVGRAAVTISSTQPGTTTYTPLAALPTLDGVPGMNWLAGEIAVVKDVVGGDLVGFFKGTTALHAAVSADDGASWSWITPATPVALAGKPSAIHQDASGRVHVLYPGAGAALYARLALARDGAGHVTGFSAQVKDVALPATVNTNLDVRCQIVPGQDQAGNATIFYALYDDPGAAARGRIQAGKAAVAAGQAPATTADFVRLDGTAGATPIASVGSGGDANASSHNNAVELAQHPGSRDLWFQWGPIDTGDTLASNTNPLVRLRATPSGPSTFALGAPVTVESFGPTAVGLGPAVSTPHSVWFLHFSPASGLVVDRAAADGTVTAGALPSPYATGRAGGYMALAVDSAESQAWVGGWVSYDSQGGGTVPDFWARHWNGTAWETAFHDPHPPADVWGVGRSVGWDQGLVLVSLDAASYLPSLATLRTAP